MAIESVSICVNQRLKPDADVAAFIRKFGYADKHDKPDRLNFGGRGARLCEPQHFRNE